MRTNYETEIESIRRQLDQLRQKLLSAFGRITELEDEVRDIRRQHDA